jgi:hypothetical protein
MERVPVMCGLECVELADASRVERLRTARNAKLIRRRRDGQVVEIQLREAGDDYKLPARLGNPGRYAYDNETPDNPRGVWTLKRVPRTVRSVFRAVVEGCAA